MIDFTGPQPVLEDSEPPVSERQPPVSERQPLATGRRARHGDRRDHRTDEPGPTRRVAARRPPEAEPSEAATTSKSRRRVGFRKGSDVDEEMWPVEAFGGVSDEQFWDDLASDKPLATTARTAQPDTAPKRRPPNAGPLPDLYPANDRGRADSAGGRGAGRGGTAAGATTGPQSRLAPDDRTAIQPAIASYQPQSPEPRGRSRASISADEDPLTSPAYSLRPKGNVDGRSYPSSRQSRDPGREQYAAGTQHDRPAHNGNGRSRPDGYRSDPLRSDPPRPDPLRSGDTYSGTAPYAYPQQSYGEPTPLYRERYGQGNPAGQAGPAGPGGGNRQVNGGRSSGPLGVNGADDGSWGPRPAYPPVNAHRGPYDPRGHHRRLSSLLNSRTLDSCPRETWSGIPLGACTRRWRDEH